MRVLFVINSFARAGAEKLVFDLAQTLAGQCDYVGVAALYDHSDQVGDEMMSTLTACGIEPFLLHKRAHKDNMKPVLELYRILRSRKIDVVHGHCSVPMLVAKLAGTAAGVPVVCTVHSTKGYSPRRERLTGWMASRYISIGAAAEQYMVGEVGIPAHRITRIYNAVDVHRFSAQPRQSDFWTEFGLSEAHPVVVSVGRLIPLKNQLCVLRAVKQCRDQGVTIQAAFLGDMQGEDSTYPMLEAFVQENRLGEQVRFLGVQQNVEQFLNHADCFVMTSRYEGLSVAFLEAVVCGCPVIATEMPFVEELNGLVKGHPCAVVIPQDDDAALAELLRGEFGRQEELVQTTFRTRFSMDRFAEAHLAVYRSVQRRKAEKK